MNTADLPSRHLRIIVASGEGDTRAAAAELRRRAGDLDQVEPITMLDQVNKLEIEIEWHRKNPRAKKPATKKKTAKRKGRK